MLKIKHIHATFQHHEIFSIFSCWKLPTSNLEALWAHLPAPSIIWKQICCESPLWHVFFIRITQCLSVSVDFNTADTKTNLMTWWASCLFYDWMGTLCSLSLDWYAAHQTSDALLQFCCVYMYTFILWVLCMCMIYYLVFFIAYMHGSFSLTVILLPSFRLWQINPRSPAPVEPYFW